MDKIRLTVTSPTGKLLEATASSVRLKAADGYFGVRAGCAPIAAALVESDILYISEGHEHSFHIIGGFAEVTDDVVTVII